MKYIKLALCLMFIFVAGTFAFASDEAAPPAGSDTDKIVVKTSVNAKEMREYKVESTIKGKAPMPDLTEPFNLDVSVLYKLRHSYSNRDSDGLLPLSISMVEGQIASQGEKLSLSSNMYPKIAVLLDRNWRFEGFFGATKEQLSKSIPGINYSNLIILFYLHDGDQPHAVGDKWESKVKLPGYGDTYNFITMITSIDEVDGVKVAKVHQDISWIVNGADEKQLATATAVADSSFAVINGKLIKSHVECQVAFDSINSKENTAPAQQEASKCSINIKTDISLAK